MHFALKLMKNVSIILLILSCHFLLGFRSFFLGGGGILLFSYMCLGADSLQDINMTTILTAQT
jgi:hypothetical protein